MGIRFYYSRNIFFCKFLSEIGSRVILDTTKAILRRKGESAMKMTAKEAEAQVKTLLIQWCDALVKLQQTAPDDPRLDGGILCPACDSVHGRCHEAVYPLLCAARLTGDDRYLAAAKRLFRWGENMHCADGSVCNDFQSDWKGVTVFAAVALHDALFFHGDLLTKAEKAAWEDRLSCMGNWLYENLTEQKPAYLNYYAANACAMALLGAYFKRDDYKALADRLAAYCLRHVSENDLIFGEGRPNDARSPKGCAAIDVGGYNAEETLPCLWRYAETTGDRETLATICTLWRAQLCWMLPDGAWDDSVGTRAFKWTYWGSRTADGCQAALFPLGKEDPVFAEAAWRNFELYRRCTHDGLLPGGPDYAKNGEPICVHHTFCHAKALAAALDAGLPDFERVLLPSDRQEALRYYPELDVYRLACENWRMDVSGYDFTYPGASHATGGSVSLLWHKAAGPLLAVGMVDYALREPHNQQQPAHPETHRCACPRLEAVVDDRRYGQHYCKTARLSAKALPTGPFVRAEATLCDQNGVLLPGGDCVLEYRLEKDALTVSGRVSPRFADKACYVLPLIGETAVVEVLVGALSGAPKPMFNLSPGFCAKEYRIFPDKDGAFRLRITVAA